MTRRSVVMAMLSAGALAFANDSGLKKVDSKFVCFITKKHFSSPQTAVNVDGKTYYSCCQMCTDKLKSDPASRMATDPVSGKQVDMAKAVVGIDKDGNAFFFENAANLKAYKPAK